MEYEIKDLLEATIIDVKSIIKRLRVIEGTLTTIQKAYSLHGERLTALESVAIFTPTPGKAE